MFIMECVLCGFLCFLLCCVGLGFCGLFVCEFVVVWCLFVVFCDICFLV